MSSRAAQSRSLIRPKRWAHARTKGLIAATVLGLACLGVVGYFMVRGGGLSRGPAETPRATDKAPDPNAVAKGNEPTIGTGTGFFLQVVDRVDPTLLRSELTAERSEPLEARRYALQQPRAWWFLRDGRTVHIRGDRGRVHVPESGGVREGSLEGSVVVRVFAKTASGTRPDPDKDVPVATLTTPSLSYDATLGQLKFDQAAKLVTEQFEIGGEGVIVQYDEARSRVALLYIARSGGLVYRTGGSQAKTEPPAASAGGVATSGGVGQTGGAGSKAASVGSAVETLYHIVAGPEVRVTRESLELTSDAMHVWARLVDGKLRPSAIAPVKIAGGERGVRANPASSSEPTPGTTSASAAPVAVVSQEADVVRVTWKGPFEARVMEAAPAELSGNDVFVRATAERAGGVRAVDTRQKVTATGVLLEYGATRRDVALGGAAPGGAVLEAQGVGRAEGARMELSLSAGKAHVLGAGRLVTLSDADEGRVSWAERGDFDFAVEGDAFVPALREARLEGGVEAIEGGGVLRATVMTARFAAEEAGPGRAGASDNQPRMRSLLAVGQVQATDGAGGMLSSDTLDVEFANAVDAQGRAASPKPSVVRARGGVLASRDGSELSCGDLEARLTTSGKPRPTGTAAGFNTGLKTGQVEWVTARDSVVFRDSNGAIAEADVLEADPIGKRADLTGTDVSVAQGGARVTGTRIVLGDAPRRLEVMGAGAFENVRDSAEGDERSKATWTRGMTFDDATGAVVAVGDASAAMTRGTLVRDTLAADTLRMWLSPADKAAGTGGVTESRRLVRGEAVSEGKVSKVEMRRYAASDPSKLERLFYVEGETIRTHAVDGVLEVPGAGKLLAVDRRAESGASTAREPADRAERGLGMGGTTRGDSLFGWKGSMRMERERGRVEMVQGVTLANNRLDGSRADLDCDRLVALFRVSDKAATDAGPESFAGQLLEAVAEGSANLRSGERRVSADILRYDAQSSTVDAQANEGRQVEVNDLNAATPLNARRILWDLTKDRIEVRSPGTISVPR